MHYERQARIQKQLRAIVVAIRPSIVWAMDGVTAPMDLLDDDGIIGWQVGLGSIRSQLKDSCDVGELPLLQWIDREQELEKSRWKDPRVVLAQARLVLGSREWQQSRDQALLNCWMQNIDSALLRTPNPDRSPHRATQRYATHVLSLLKHDDLKHDDLKHDDLKHDDLKPGTRTQLVLGKLERLTQLEPLPAEIESAREDTSRLASDADLTMLCRWLCATPAHQVAAV